VTISTGDLRENPANGVVAEIIFAPRGRFAAGGRHDRLIALVTGFIGRGS
jgi:hypothetical protein